MRPATPDDADRIADIDMLLFENAFNEKTLRTELELGSCWVEGAPALGYVLIRRDEDITDITRLAVHPEAQGKGIGKLLLLRALEMPGPHMLTVKKDNGRALELYKKHGFEIVAELPDIPAWVMRREITSAGT